MMGGCMITRRWLTPLPEICEPWSDQGAIGPSSVFAKMDTDSNDRQLAFENFHNGSLAPPGGLTILFILAWILNVSPKRLQGIIENDHCSETDQFLDCLAALLKTSLSACSAGWTSITYSQKFDQQIYRHESSQWRGSGRRGNHQSCQPWWYLATAPVAGKMCAGRVSQFTWSLGREGGKVTRTG